jgi:hypothetical protein
MPAEVIGHFNAKADTEMRKTDRDSRLTVRLGFDRNAADIAEDDVDYDDEQEQDQEQLGQDVEMAGVQPPADEQPELLIPPGDLEVQPVEELQPTDDPVSSTLDTTYAEYVGQHEGAVAESPALGNSGESTVDIQEQIREDLEQVRAKTGYSLRSRDGKRNWRNYNEHFNAVVLVNISIPKAIREIGQEALRKATIYDL